MHKQASKRTNTKSNANSLQQQYHPACRHLKDTFPLISKLRTAGNSILCRRLHPSNKIPPVILALLLPALQSLLPVLSRPLQSLHIHTTTLHSSHTLLGDLYRRLVNTRDVSVHVKRTLPLVKLILSRNRADKGTLATHGDVGPGGEILPTGLLAGLVGLLRNAIFADVRVSGRAVGGTVVLVHVIVDFVEIATVATVLAESVHGRGGQVRGGEGEALVDGALGLGGFCLVDGFGGHGFGVFGCMGCCVVMGGGEAVLELCR